MLGIVSATAVLLLVSLTYIGESPVEAPIVQADQKDTSEVSSGAKSIATEWDWEQFKEESETGLSGTELDAKVESVTVQTAKQFDLNYIYQSLHAVRLDDEGDVILDHEALSALNKVFSYQNLNFNNEQLETLQAIIKKGLPGEAGEQTADIVGNYYQFLDAEQEFNTLYETRSNPEDAKDLTIEDFQTQFEELQALRSLYMGDETAEKLFTVSDANAAYMFESKALEDDMSLSDEEKSTRQKEAVKRLDAITIGVEDWSDRYVAFLDEKQQLLNASLTEEDKQRQLSRLLESHFSLTELEKVSHLALEVL